MSDTPKLTDAAEGDSCPPPCSAVLILRDIVEQFDGPALADDQKDALAAAHEWLHEHDPDPECCPKCSAGVRKLAWRREWMCDSCGLIFLPNTQAQPRQ